MTIEYLQDLLTRIKALDPSNLLEAEELRIKAIEGLRVLFPNEYFEIIKILDLKFEPSEAPASDTYKFKFFHSSRIKMQSFLEAKIEFLKLQEKLIVDSNSTLQQKVNVIDNQNRSNLIKKNNDMQRIIGERNIDLEKQRSEIIRLKSENNKKQIYWGIKSVAVWGIIIAFFGILIGLAYTIGIGNGKNYDDIERSKLRDSISKQANQIDSLKKRIKILTLKQSPF